MKRKTKNGHKLISQLLAQPKVEKENKPQNLEEQSEDAATSEEFIQNLMYVYRAYANFVLEEYNDCVKDYQKAN